VKAAKEKDSYSLLRKTQKELRLVKLAMQALGSSL